MDKSFRIGDFCFRLCCPEEIVPPTNFMLFEVDEGQTEYSYSLSVSEEFPEPEGTLVAKRPDLMVYRQSSGYEQRLIGIKGQEGYYACYTEVSDQSAEIVLSPERISGLHIDPVFTSLLALEKRMILKDSMILHCAYIAHEGQAILFSAPSETGKTTQAKLWEKYRQARTVNGDRALLQKINGNWTAQGWPVCGTSEVCHHQMFPIRAIVMLSQGKMNEVRSLNAAEAFRLLYTQITVNSWNREDVIRAMNQMESLIAAVPVFHLSCTISEEAVVCLEQALYN